MISRGDRHEPGEDSERDTATKGSPRPPAAPVLSDLAVVRLEEIRAGDAAHAREADLAAQILRGGMDLLAVGIAALERAHADHLKHSAAPREPSFMPAKK